MLCAVGSKLDRFQVKNQVPTGSIEVRAACRSAEITVPPLWKTGMPIIGLVSLIYFV